MSISNRALSIPIPISSSPSSTPLIPIPFIPCPLEEELLAVSNRDFGLLNSLALELGGEPGETTLCLPLRRGTIRLFGPGPAASVSDGPPLDDNDDCRDKALGLALGLGLGLGLGEWEWEEWEE